MNSGRQAFFKYGKILLLSVCGFMLIAAGGERKVVNIDFKKASSYVHDINTRPDFPVTVPLLRDYVYSTLALGDRIDAARKNSIIMFVDKVRRTDGGFSVDPATQKTSSLYTDYTVEALAYMGALNKIDTRKVKAYLASLKRPDGGFSFDAQTNGSSLPSTYNAIHCLAEINGLDIVDKTRAAAYINGFERKDTGGFNYVKGKGVAEPKDTYMAVYCLKTLGMLDDGTKNRAIKYLVSTPYAGTNKKYTITQTLEEQAYTIMALKLLGASDRIVKGGAKAFIRSFYIPQNGGFGSIHGYGSAPDPTYFGILGLSELGVLKRPVKKSFK